MRLSQLFRATVVSLVAVGTLATGAPAHAAPPATNNATCTVQRTALPQKSAAYDMNCVGTPEMTGAWHLQEQDGIVNGTGPKGALARGTVVSTNCTVYVSVVVAVCKAVRLEVCVDNWCAWVTVIICTYHRVTVCLEYFADTAFGTGQLSDAAATAPVTGGATSGAGSGTASGTGGATQTGRA